METPSIDKLQYARAWADNAMRNSFDWKIFEYTSVMYAAKDKVFVVWDYIQGQPRVAALLVVERPGISFQHGLMIEVHDLISDKRLVIDQRPAQVVKGVFMWLSPFTDARYAPLNYAAPEASEHRLTLPFCVRTKTHPTKSLTEGHRYISAHAEFETRWPNIE